MSGYDFNSDEIVASFNELIPHLRAGNTEAAVEVFQKSWTAGPRRSMNEVDPIVRRRVQAMLREGFQPGKAQGEGTWPDPPAIGRLGEIKTPTLIVIGEYDMPDILDIGNLLVGGVAGARKVIIPNAAHMVNMEQPAEFNRIVLDFLARQ
jgi:pimeloyl-ACP methyl ester carboxylesterase